MCVRVCRVCTTVNLCLTASTPEGVPNQTSSSFPPPPLLRSQTFFLSQVRKKKKTPPTHSNEEKENPTAPTGKTRKQTMLLPSALPCEGRAAVQASPVRRSSRQSHLLTSYCSPPLEEPTIISNATSGLLQTCKRLHQILSVDRASTPPPSTEKLREVPQPSTPRRPTVRRGVVRTPVNKNKRCRAAAFAGNPPDHDEGLRDPFSTPKNKRVKMATAPSPPNRNLRDMRSPLREEEEQQWTANEDRVLVELVLQRLRLTKDDWEDCARSLGRRNAKSLGRRWENLVANKDVGLREKRRLKLRARN